MASPYLHAAYKDIAVADILTTVAAANTLVPAELGKRYKIVNVTVKAIGGNAGGSTALLVGAGTEVAWQMTTTDVDQNVINLTNSANVTATHVGHWAPANTAIAILRTGTVTTTATSIQVTVYYVEQGGN
jgi:hypothetical protein